MSTKKVDWIVFICIFILALFIRLIYALALEMPIPIRGDGVHYVQYASNLIEHFTFSKDRSPNPVPDSYWAPGYPIFLAFCMLVAKFVGIHFYPLTLLVQAVFGAVVAALSYKLGRQVLSHKGALFAAVFTTFSPHLISHGGYILSETLLSFLLITSIYIYIQATSSRNKRLYLLSGLFFGCSYLVNPVILVVPISMVLYVLIFGGERKIWAPIFTIGFFIVVSIWGIRGLTLTDGKASTSDRAFENLIIGSHDVYHDMWKANPRDKNNPYEIDLKKYKDNHEAFYKKLMTRIIENPGHYFKWYLIQKPMDLWGWDILVGQGDIYVYTVSSSLYSKSKLALLSWTLMKHTHYLLLFLLVVGMMLVYREKDTQIKENVITLYIMLISMSMVYVILHSDARYSVPMRPEMYICAVYAMKIIYKYMSLLVRNMQKIRNAKIDVE